MKLSIVVVTHRGGVLLQRCLDHIEPQLRSGDELVVVVSARSWDESRRGARYLELGENVGFAKAANRGMEQVDGDAIVLLNDDTRPLPGFLDALRIAVARPAVVQPRILLADGSGRLDNAGHGLFFDGFNWARGREDQDGEAYDEPGSVGAVSGAAMCLHREVLERVGLFDEDLEAFGEDVDLCLRARRAGFPLLYAPEARIEHELGATYGRYGRRKVYLVERNRVRAAARSLPFSAVLTMPAWTGLRWAALGAGATVGRGWTARTERGAVLAALAGTASGLSHLPDALRKRRRDARGWTVDERAMWRHLWAHRVRARDLWR